MSDQDPGASSCPVHQPQKESKGKGKEKADQHQQTHHQQPLELTFGVEAEYCLWPRASMFSKNWRQRVAQVLETAHIDVAVEDELEETQFHQWTVAHDSSIDRHHGHAKDLELISRVLPFDESGLEEVRAVITLVRSAFDLTNDQSTGLHVHVGNGIHGFPLKTLQNLNLIWVGFEYLWNSLHPDERVMPLPDSGTHFAEPPSSSQVLARWRPGYEQMLHIAQTTSFRGLLRLTQPRFSVNRYASLNMDGMMGKDHWGYEGADHTRTLEFRQHAGTSDTEAIGNWITVVCNLVKFAHQVDDSTLGKLLLRCAPTAKEPRALNLGELLQAIGCSPDLKSYYIVRQHLRPQCTYWIPLRNDLMAEEFLSALHDRDAMMQKLEAEWTAAGKRDTRNLTRYTYEAASVSMKDPWFRWAEWPFNMPWDLRMSKWSGVDLPESALVAMRKKEAERFGEADEQEMGPHPEDELSGWMDWETDNEE